MRPRSGAAFALVTALLAAVALGGCTSPRNTLGTTSSPCFRSLAAAQDAVGQDARFAGVRSTTLGAVATTLSSARPPVVEIAGPVAAPRTRVCVVAYRGDFRRSAIGRGWQGRVGRGRLALVVVRLRDTRVLDTVVLARAPFGLTRVFPPLR